MALRAALGGALALLLVTAGAATTHHVAGRAAPRFLSGHDPGWWLRGSPATAQIVAAKELPPLNLTDALDLTMLIARKDPRRHPRVAGRWLLRYLEECEATIDEADGCSPPRHPSSATAVTTRR